MRVKQAQVILLMPATPDAMKKIRQGSLWIRQQSTPHARCRHTEHPCPEMTYRLDILTP
jgi:hypothetical protein